MAPFDQTTASRAVLIEVVNVLGAFRDDFVLVGGWVPELLFPDCNHPGSLDVDLAISPTAARGNAYESLLKRLLEAGYSHEGTPTRFIKNVEGIEVKVDLIAGEYGGGDKALMLRVDELQFNTLRGLDLAFEVCDTIEISGVMPDGTHNRVRARIVQPEAFILIKAFAMEERAKPKDAYDIAFVLRNYSPDVEDLGEKVRRLLSNGLAAEGFEILQRKFERLESVGPTWAAQVSQEQGEVFEQSQRAAFEYARVLFDEVATG